MLTVDLAVNFFQQGIVIQILLLGATNHAPHQRARDVGCQTGSQLLSARSHEPDLTASVRQCDDSGVSEEGGGHSVSKTVPPRNRHSQNDQRHVHYAGRKAHPSL